MARLMHAAVAVALIAAVLAGAVSGETWTVTRNAANTTVTFAMTGGDSETIDVPGADVTMIGALEVSFLSVGMPVDADNSTLWSDDDTVSLVSAASGAVHEVVVRSEMPYVNYVSDGGLSCTFVLPTGTSFSCNDGNVTYAKVTKDDGAVEVTVVLSGTAEGNDAITEDALSLAGHRTGALALTNSLVGEIKQLNEDRLASVRSAVLALYIFIVIGMILISFVVAIWMHWCVPVFRGLGSLGTVVWGIAILVVFVVLALVGGAGGWIACAGLIFLIITFMPVAYFAVVCGCCCFNARKNFGEHGEILRTPSKAELTNAVAKSYTSENSSASASSSASSSAGYDEQEEASGASSATTNTAAAEAEIKQTKELRGVPNSCCGKQYTWQYRPYKMTEPQTKTMICLSVAVTVCTIVCFITFLSMTVDPYWVYDRAEGVSFIEFQPQLTARSIMVLYAYDGWASFAKFNWLLAAQTSACGPFFSTVLTTDEEKKTSINDNFIVQYDIDMSIYNRTEYHQYESVNDWFSRTLAPGARPTAKAGDNSVVSSGADCRVTAFQDTPDDLTVWLKDEEFTMASLLDNEELAEDFEGGSVVILRLAPADYHRTHTPVSGNITYMQEVESTIYSVNADSIRAENGAIFNQRTVTIIEAETPSGPQKVGFVAIGATCVGSVVMTKEVGDHVERGDEISYFEFGGSTVVLTFPKDAITIDEDLITWTNEAVEALIQVGSQIAVWN